MGAKFSLRQAIVAVTLCAVGSLVLAEAARGALWARASVTAAAVGLVTAAGMLVVHALFFGLVNLLARFDPPGPTPTQPAPGGDGR